MSVPDVASFTWGVLVGFVGWGSLPRLPHIIALFLLPRGSRSTTAAAAAICALFLILAILGVLAIVPLVSHCTSAVASVSPPDMWRRTYGAAFVGSLIGLFVNGAFQKWG